MPSQTTPPVTVAKPPGGVLPISAVTDGKHAAATVASRSNQPQRAGPQQRTKLVLRRLPPGITQAEFDTALGDAWKPGRGKVNWADFRPGKVSKDVSKPSRPARVYLQIPKSEDAEELAQIVAKASFADSRNTATDPVLIGPPVLEYALYGRIPSNKRRNDARQGTIDQDPEFIEFLESLTNPIAKPKALDPTPITKEDSATVTPLIQHLRDKKAAKEKAASNKAAKQQKSDAKEPASESKTERKRGGRDSTKSADKENRPAKNTDSKGQSGKEASAKSSSRTDKDKTQGTRQAATSSSRSQSESSAPATQSNKSTAAQSTRRPDATSAAARMIQRDLGLRSDKRGTSKSSRGAKATAESRATTPTASSATDQATPASPQPQAAKASAASVQAQETIAPKDAAKMSQVQQKSGGAQRQNNKAKTTPSDSAATKAFLKHANPSQGITEASITQAMTGFGTVSAVDLDKRKGFAIVTFSASAGLQAAMAASPVTVAQGSVQVLEWKQRGGAPASQTQQSSPPSGPPATNGTPATNASARGGRATGSRGGPRGRGRAGNANGGRERAGGAAAAASTAEGKTAVPTTPAVPPATTTGATT